jgi:hypothetical protein
MKVMIARAMQAAGIANPTAQLTFSWIHTTTARGGMRRAKAGGAGCRLARGCARLALRCDALCRGPAPR